MTFKPAEEVIAYEPDRTLREIVGETIELSQIFTRERIAAGQQVVRDAGAVFFDKAAVEVKELEEMLEKNPELPKDGDSLFDDIAIHAVNIKGPAEQFGYALVAEIGGHIVSYCEPGSHTAAARYLVVRELVKLLRKAVQGKIADETGVIGKELRISLSAY